MMNTSLLLNALHVSLMYSGVFLPRMLYTIKCLKMLAGVCPAIKNARILMRLSH
ncbi:Hypothetical protein FKW44_010640 [Caligus rogercresseyi]|uniref:Uncharacterized protein n=1 Tax=Caligus rogercresseyi TaxID=217165 RepID=A0A7T8K8B0_CALRO|nr:Hypothetical protein FKW44_010640 [Caligus rogercresseyi]